MPQSKTFKGVRTIFKYLKVSDVQMGNFFMFSKVLKLYIFWKVVVYQFFITNETSNIEKPTTQI